MVELVKKAAVEAVDAGKPVAFLYGVVVSVSPLKVQVDQKVTYTEKMLILTREVTDYEMDIELSGKTSAESGGSDNASFASHSHTLSGVKKIKVKNALQLNDQVLLARMQGGKQFVILGRIKPAPTIKGEWV